MTSPETTILREAIVSVISSRAGSGADSTVVAAATHRAYGDLSDVLDSLIGQAGTDALFGRAFLLTLRPYPSPLRLEKEADTAPIEQVTLWLQRQDPVVASNAAVATFVKFAELLAALIGQPLTTRYLRRAWPEFPEARPEGTSQ